MIQNFRTLMMMVCSTLWACSAVAQTSDFLDQSEAAGLLGSYLNHSASVADYDLDGDLDVYIGSRLASNTLYRNEGNATFVPVVSGVEDEGFTMATLFFDYDNDGDPDLLSCNTGDANHFWRNDGGGVFTDVTDELGLGQESQCRGAHAADINMDGWLDLYIVNMNQPNAFWLSDGEGGFTDGYYASGATDNLIGMGALFLDIENDGDLDLYLTHDANQMNKLYINDGEGLFTNQAEAWGLNLQAQGMGVDATDLNHDGFLDLFISNNLPNDLYLNPGAQPESGPVVPFDNITEDAGVGDAGMGWGTVFIDHDHDGERDLYVANEYFFSPFPNLLYHNNGDLTFTDIAEGSALESPFSGYATVVADFDANGAEDLLVVNTLVSANPGCQLFLNHDTTNHWIGFELEGVVSPRDAAGARVVVHSGPDFQRTDASFIGYSYSSCGPLTFNFGLGDRTAVDSVEVFWPSGIKTVTVQPDVDQYHSLLETPCFGVEPDLDWPETAQLCPGDALVLTVPDGWTAAGWTLGVEHPEGREIAQEGVVQALLSSGNCSVLSPALEVAMVEAVPPVIVADGPPRFCQGTLRQLSVPGPQVDVLWSNGIASNLLYVGSSDTLTVTTTNVCGHIDTSDPLVIETFESPSVPIVAPALVAAGSAHTFEPIQLEGEALRWYAPYGPNALSDLQAGSTEQVGPFIYQGPVYSTPPLGASTGWWVKAAGMRDDRQAVGGKEAPSSGGFIGSDAYGLTFDAHEDIVLDRVQVLADGPGPRTFQLRSIQAEILMEITQDLEPGWNAVELGFPIAEGTGYALLVSAPEVGLWRDNVGSEQGYPYAVGEMATITSSTIPSSAGGDYYYFFYDWEVSSQGLMCESEAAAAYVEVVDAISGCTYAFAANFDPQASLDDGSCFLQGCIDPAAPNYNPLASQDDGSCAVTCDSDLNGDGQIGAPDLLELLSAWGSVCD
ncbi:CRTAC1 family protein [Flavobacteriales bacterium]|nr:CRTAC1 family protein [Flavobacteriales bacterium]